MWEEISPIIITFVITILGTVLTTVATIVGLKAQQLVEKAKIKTGIEIDEKLASEAVEWAEQVFKDSKGQEKFEKAKDRLVLLMNERGVPVSEEVIDTLIEKAVLGLKKGWNEGQETVVKIEPIEVKSEELLLEDKTIELQ